MTIESTTNDINTYKISLKDSLKETPGIYPLKIDIKTFNNPPDPVLPQNEMELEFNLKIRKCDSLVA